MKNYLSLAIIVIAIAFSSCVGSQNRNQEATSNDTIQEKLTADTIMHRFFDRWIKIASEAPDNEMKYLELYDERQKELMALNDSIGFFDNIKCAVYEVDYNQYRDTYQISLVLYENPSPDAEYIQLQGYEMGKVNLYHIGKIDKKDPIYIKSKELQQGDEVYISGTFVVDHNNNEPRGDKDYLVTAHTLFSMSEYYFNILDISKKALPKQEENVFEAIRKGRQATNYLFKDWRKEKDFRKSTLDSLTKSFNEAKKTLSDSDSLFVQRYVNSIISDFKNWE